MTFLPTDLHYSLKETMTFLPTDLHYRLKETMIVLPTVLHYRLKETSTEFLNSSIGSLPVFRLLTVFKVMLDTVSYSEHDRHLIFMYLNKA